MSCDKDLLQAVFTCLTTLLNAVGCSTSYTMHSTGEAIRSNRFVLKLRKNPIIFMQVLIPHHAVWEPNAAFATDFHIRLRRPRETGSVQISITSQDDYGSDIPLNVPPRVRVTWHPRNFAGVQRIKKTWEESEVKAANTLPRNVNPQSPSTQRKSSSLPRYQQPVYLGIEKMLQERTVSPRNQDHSNQTEGSRYGDKRMPEQDKRWNVVTSPTYNNQAPSDMKVSSDEELPQWAKGLGDQYDYDDVVVV